MGNAFNVGQQRIAQIRLRANGRGEPEFFEALTHEINELSKQWEGFPAGELSQTEHAGLIESKHRLLQYMQRIQAQSKSDAG